MQAGALVACHRAAARAQTLQEVLDVLLAPLARGVLLVREGVTGEVQASAVHGLLAEAGLAAALALPDEEELILTGPLAGCRAVPVGQDGVSLGLLVVADLPEADAAELALSAGAEVARALRDEQLRRRATCDPVTGLSDAGVLEQQAAAALAARAGREVGVLLLGVDQLDAVARSFGRAARNDLLRKVAGRLLRVDDPVVAAVARVGPAFGVLVVGPPGSTGALAPRLVAELERPWPFGRREVRSTARAGSAVADDATSAAHLLERAEAALAESARQPAGGWTPWTAALTAASHEVLLLETLLQAALGRGELRVRYQPQVDLVSGRITGCEALVRWERATGTITPDRFLPAAESTGLIVEIDRWVLREACRQLQAWREAGLPPLRMAVNVSSRTLAAPGFADEVLAALAAHDVPPDLLEVEVTESLELLEATDAVAELARLRALGVHVALDDFGTGYSNVLRLRTLPVDRVKIDQSFVREIAGGEGALCSAVLALARTLDLDVIAEGVETEEQRAFLDAGGCPSFQGYLVSPAVDAAAFAALVTA